MLSAKQANRRYFRQAYRTGRHGWAVEEPSPYVLAFLGRLARLAAGGRLLDVGCGEGRHAFAAGMLGFDVTAIDYEPLALRRARELAKTRRGARVVFQRADFLRLPLRKGHFDVVLDCGCLHHQRKVDWPAYRASLLAALKPRGYYVLSVFGPGFRLFRGRRNWHIAQGAYRRCFTRREIRDRFDRDFEILDLVAERGRGGGFWHALMRRRQGR